MKSGKCSFLGQIANEMNSFVYIYSCAEVLWMHMQKEKSVLLIEQNRIDLNKFICVHIYLGRSVVDAYAKRKECIVN